MELMPSMLRIGRIAVCDFLTTPPTVPHSTINDFQTFEPFCGCADFRTEHPQFLPAAPRCAEVMEVKREDRLVGASVIIQALCAFVSIDHRPYA